MKNLMITILAFSFFVIGCDDGDMDDALEITIPVHVMELKRGPIKEYVTATANIFAEKKAALVSKSEGYYRVAQNPATKKPFRPGDKVKVGQVIIFIDNPEFESNITFDSKKLNLDISQREFEKQQSLYEKGGVTLRELKNAESSFINAKYAFDNAKIQLQKLKVTAPFDGTITSLPFYTRAVFVSAAQPMAEVMDYSSMYANVSFPANKLGQVKIGQQVIVTQYNLPQDTLYGEVKDVDPTLSIENRSFNARIVISNPQAKLRPGMFAKLQTIVAARDSAIVISKDIILSKRRGKTVFVVDKNAAQLRTISTGLENEQMVEVLSGLKENERLVIKGFETLRNRSKVKIVR